jgi:glycosidase
LYILDDSASGYRSYFCADTLPVLNVDNLEARQGLIDIACYWLREFDVDGFRLDHANGPGPGFWAEFWTACRREKPDCFCFGEVVLAPTMLNAYAGRMDACLDFLLAETLRKAYAFESISRAEFDRMLARHLAFRSPQLLYPTFLDNHDQDRFLFIAGNKVDVLQEAAAVQMKLPAPPIIYYGTEVGLSQYKSKADGGGDKQARLPMIWSDKQDTELLEFYKGLIQDRRSHYLTK